MPFQHNLPPTNRSVEVLFRGANAGNYLGDSRSKEAAARVALGVEIGKTTLTGLSTRYRCGVIAVAYVPGNPEQLTVVRRKVDQHGEPIRQFGPWQRNGRAIFSANLGEWRTPYEEDVQPAGQVMSIHEVFASVSAIADGSAHNPSTNDVARHILQMNRHLGGLTGVDIIDQAMAQVADAPLRRAV